ncbi:di-trans,poly-cis-decaprenylcistransferase [Desulfovibrio sp. OttesenSCG-928-M14]|nr:di-trans,poly-cis-decaprenylcistransferase [Desulfovibrio sp. OttesenSCG-928-M16]MDL2216326.1 di-trans,poly-cis-decaprenylcistransferase [Desulfovibrio sp. OttesenSCG-928-M14]
MNDAPTLPRHVAIIMDGNGRWAAARNLPRSEGHRAGTESAREIVEECLKLGIPHLTLYTFSKENWRRPKNEVSFLFGLLVDFITRELPSLERRGVQLRVLGDAAGLPLAARSTLAHACERTSANRAMILNLALNYSGRDEIARACRLCLEAGLKPGDINPDALAERLYTAGQPDPDLVIRSSGEQRLSNFLLFQSAYSEFHFTDALWPDFSPQHLRTALEDFAARKRRFGGSDSVKE